MNVSENNFAPIFALLDRRSQTVSNMLRLYRERRLPLSSLAKLLGSSTIETWANLIRMRDGLILSATGDAADIAAEKNLLLTSDEVVLDMSALLTIVYLGVEVQVARRFSRILIPQAVRDEVNEVLTKDYLGPQAAAVLSKQGQQYVREELTPESREAGQEFLERLRLFIDSRGTLTPAMKVLQLEKGTLERYSSLLGKSPLASALLASERGVPLFTDDLGLRVLARTTWGVKGVWTQSVLGDMLRLDILSEEEHHAAIRKLVLGNYEFVSITEDNLMWLLRQNAFSTSGEVAAVFRALQGPRCSEGSAVAVLASLIRKVWLDLPIWNLRLLVLDLILRTLTGGRPGTQAINALKRELSTKFALIPVQLGDVMSSIAVWEHHRLTRGGK